MLLREREKEKIFFFRIIIQVFLLYFIGPSRVKKPKMCLLGAWTKNFPSSRGLWVLFASSLDWKSLECRLRWSTCLSSL